MTPPPALRDVHSSRDPRARVAELQGLREPISLGELLDLVRSFEYRTSLYRDRQRRAWWRAARRGAPSFVFRADRDPVQWSAVAPVLRQLEEVDRRDD